MLTKIEKNLLGRLQDKGLQVKAFDIKPEGRKGIVTPAAFARIDTGKITKVTQDKFRVDVYPVLSLIFKNMTSEEKRRKGIYPLLMAVLDYLTLNKLGIEIDPLVPVAFQNVTDEDDIQAGLIVFQIKFKTYFYITAKEDEVAGELLRVNLQYFLQDPVDNDVKDAEDTVELEQS